MEGQESKSDLTEGLWASHEVAVRLLEKAVFSSQGPTGAGQFTSKFFHMAVAAGFL